MEDKDNLKWCPAPNCVYVVDCGIKKRELGRIVPTVRCDCGHNFCFGCILTDHLPAPCSIVKKWMKKCEDDSETANWISANTKECPKCNSTIEKNGGCNHMTWYAFLAFVMFLKLTVGQSKVQARVLLDVYGSMV